MFGVPTPLIELKGEIFHGKVPARHFYPAAGLDCLQNIVKNPFIKHELLNGWGSVYFSKLKAKPIHIKRKQKGRVFSFFEN